MVVMLEKSGTYMTHITIGTLSKCPTLCRTIFAAAASQIETRSIELHTVVEVYLKGG